VYFTPTLGPHTLTGAESRKCSGADNVDYLPIFDLGQGVDSDGHLLYSLDSCKLSAVDITGQLCSVSVLSSESKPATLLGPKLI
jgi:hypothetical protein